MFWFSSLLFCFNTLNTSKQTSSNLCRYQLVSFLFMDDVNLPSSSRPMSKRHYHHKSCAKRRDKGSSPLFGYPGKKYMKIKYQFTCCRICCASSSLIVCAALRCDVRNIKDHHRISSSSSYRKYVSVLVNSSVLIYEKFRWYTCVSVMSVIQIPNLFSFMFCFECFIKIFCRVCVLKQCGIDQMWVYI